MARHVIVKLTIKEAEELSSVAENGWGDGDYYNCGGYGGQREAAAYLRAISKLRTATYNARQKKG